MSELCLARVLQEVDAAGAWWRSDPHEAEDGGGLVTDVGGNHAADKLGPAKLSLGHHTWKSRERRRCQLTTVMMLVHISGNNGPFSQNHVLSTDGLKLLCVANL